MNSFFSNLIIFSLLFCLCLAQANFSARSAAKQKLIAAGEDVTLDKSVTLTDQLTIEGTLRCANVDLNLSVPRIIIRGSGKLLCGTASSRYTKKLTITLTGPKSSDDTIFNSKCIATLDTATLELHGESRSVTWTQLGATAAKGAKQIKLKEAVDWKVGEQIVIASTDFDMNQAEQRTISAVDASKTLISFESPLTFMHFGVLQNFQGNKKVLDERAEVGLLSRNIVIKGDDVEAKKRHGGHVIITDNAIGRIEGVELTQVGLGSTLGRYPLHFHLRGTVNGQYLKKNSIHHSFNRCITIHGTSKLLVEDNVCYHHTGHGYFIEDGFEQQNKLIHNLGLVTKRMSSSDATIPTDHTTVSTFWITNPNNEFRFNSAAGSDHAGFWFALPYTPLDFGDQAPYNTTIRPSRTKLLVFDDNVGHSAIHSNLGIDGQPKRFEPEKLSLVHGHYAPLNNPLDGKSGKAVPIIRRFLSYKSRDRSVWMRANTMRFEDCVYADNGLSTLFAFNQIQTNSLYVGISANTGNPRTPLEIAAKMSLPNGNRNSLSGRHFNGHAIYDGPTVTLNSHFANFNYPWAKAFGAVGAAVKSPVHIVKGITWESTPLQNRVDFLNAGERGTIWSSGIIDRDGSVVGKAGATVVGKPAEHPGQAFTADQCFSAVDGLCQDHKAWGAMVCEGVRYGHLFLEPQSPSDNSQNSDISVSRSDGPTAVFNGRYGTFGGDQLAVIVNKNLRYRFVFARISPTIRLRYTFANPNEVLIVELPNYPTLAKVEGATKVDTVAQLNAASGSVYLQHNNNVWVKLVAAGTVSGPGYEDENGAPHYPATKIVKLCTKANCPSNRNNPVFDVAALADYQDGTVDVHGNVATQPGLKIAKPLAYHPQNGDGINYYDIESAAHNERKYADYTLTFAPQNWQIFRAIKFKITAGCVSGACAAKPQYEIHLRDNDGHMYLGKGVGEFELSLVDLNITRLDKVDRIYVRVYNKDFLAGGDLTKTAVLRTHLFGIYLLHYETAFTALKRTADNPYTSEATCAKANRNIISIPATPMPSPLPEPIGIPFGHFDAATPTYIRGWACDEHAGTAPVQLHIYIALPAGNPTFHASITANQPRPDVTKVYPRQCPGGYHGFHYYFDAPNAKALNKDWETNEVPIYVYVIGVGEDKKNDGQNPRLNVKYSTIKPLANPPKITPPPATPPPAPAASKPVGSLDGLSKTRVTGWACDADKPTEALKVRVYIGSTLYTEAVANTARPDLKSVAACGGSTAHGYSVEFTGPKILSSYATTPQTVKVIAVNVGPDAGSNNPTLGQKQSVLERSDAPTPTTKPSGTPSSGGTTKTPGTPAPTADACPKGTAGCRCDADKCQGNLSCVGDSCVVSNGCTAGETGCSCNQGACESSRDECVADSCVRRSCQDGLTGCPCFNVGDGSDPSVYPCADEADECVRTLYGDQCLPKKDCRGALGCQCDDQNPCDAPGICGLDARCALPECPASTLGCGCSALGYCSESLSCIAGKCIKSSCDGQLACPCRKNGVANDQKSDDYLIDNADEVVVYACDGGLKCAQTLGNSRGFCVLGAIKEPNAVETEAPATNEPVSAIESVIDGQVSVLTLILAVLGAVCCVLIVVGIVVFVLMRRRDDDSSSSPSSAPYTPPDAYSNNFVPLQQTQTMDSGSEQYQSAHFF